MKLDTFDYIYNRGGRSEWRIEGCQLGQINLIVGKNATGKSRIVRAIYLLSQLLSGRQTVGVLPDNNDCHLWFDKESEQRTEYILKLDHFRIIQEQLIIGGKTLLERDKSGEGNILAEAEGKKIRFQNPDTTELELVKRRDTLQHPFLENIHQWASSLRFYEFGTQLGKKTVARLTPHIEAEIESFKENINTKNTDNVVLIFVIGKQTIGENFAKVIIGDMQKVGYNISEIDTKIPDSLTRTISSFDNSKSFPYFIYVKEKDLNSITEQAEMSQGMFRVLSLLIQVNYSLLSGKPSCIIIDDIGEGLDYQRSSSIIKVLIEKAKTGLIQLIMTTNDEFIMNGVPLEYWSVIERKSGSAKLHNFSNSPEQFKQFEYIGLNNFDFFTSEFYLRESEKEEAID